MYVFGPLGLLFIALPLERILSRFALTWVPERRRDVVLFVAAGTPLLPAVTAAATVGQHGYHWWDAVILSALMGIAWVPLGLLTLHATVMLTDGPMGRASHRLSALSVFWVPEPLRSRLIEMKGPLWTLFTPIGIVRQQSRRH